MKLELLISQMETVSFPFLYLGVHWFQFFENRNGVTLNLTISSSEVYAGQIFIKSFTQRRVF